MSRHDQFQKRTLFVVSALLCGLWLCFFLGLAWQNESAEKFRFLFVSDLHMHPGADSVSRIRDAVDQINGLNPTPDFVILGGDLIENMYIRDYESAAKLYDLYEETCDRLKMPVYSVLGNNDVVPNFKESPIGKSHVLDGKDMFRDRVGNGSTYRSFDHKGWHFVLLDSIERGKVGKYRGYIDEVQMKWLSEDLEKLENGEPVCVALHIPLATIFTQTFVNSMKAPLPHSIVNNGTEVIRLLANYNVKLVLQGHHHIVEELKFVNMAFLSGGSISHARKYQNFVHHEGFVVVDVNGSEFLWNYCPLADKTY